MGKEKCEENFAEKTNSDTNKSPDNKSNSKKTSKNNNFPCDNIFEVDEEAKNKTPFNANRIEKELEEMKIIKVALQMLKKKGSN